MSIHSGFVENSEILKPVYIFLDFATTSKFILSEENVQTDVDNDEKYAIAPIDEGSLLLQTPPVYWFDDSQSSSEFFTSLYYLNGILFFKECYVSAEAKQTSINMTNNSSVTHIQSEKVSLPQMKKVYTLTIRSIDLTLVIHPDRRQKHLENALYTFF